MSSPRRSAALEWGFRLLLLAGIALWVAFPPHGAKPAAGIAQAASSPVGMR
jgi:hypothetical protein